MHTLGRVFITEHAVERFIQRIVPWLLPSEALPILERLASTARYDESRTYSGEAAWRIDIPPCWLVTRVAQDEDGRQVVVTILDGSADIGGVPHRAARNTAVRSGGMIPVEETCR